MTDYKQECMNVCKYIMSPIGIISDFLKNESGVIENGPFKGLHKNTKIFFLDDYGPVTNSYMRYTPGEADYEERMNWYVYFKIGDVVQEAVLHGIDHETYVCTFTCHGKKCKEYTDISEDYWCTRCHGPPEEKYTPFGLYKEFRSLPTNLLELSKMKVSEYHEYTKYDCEVYDLFE